VCLSVYVSVFDSIYYVVLIFSESFKNFILIAGPILDSTDENRSGSYDPPASDPVSSGLTNPVLSGLSFSDPKDLSITDEEKELMRLAAQAKVEGAKGIFIIYFLFFICHLNFSFLACLFSGKWKKQKLICLHTVHQHSSSNLPSS
jgi:hypothetical protein